MAAAQSAQLTADLATTDQARLDALSRGDRMARQRRRGRSFERGERSKGAGGGGSGVDAAALEEAELMFGDMLRERGYQAGATDMAIKQAIEAAAKSFAEGGNEKVARDAALSKLSSLTGADFKSATVKDPFLAELLGDQPLGVPMMRLSDATGGHEPQVLTQINNITNNWEIDFNVDGAGDAAAAVDGIRQIIREEFTSVAGESARSQQVNFPR